MDAEYRQTTRKGHEMRREDEDEEKNQKESTAGKKNSYSFSLQNDKSTTREKIRTISRLNLKHKKFINDTSHRKTSRIHARARMSDEPPQGNYKEVLMNGRRERNHAHTGMTPPAKAASPSHQGTDRDDRESTLEAVEPYDGSPDDWGR